MRQTSIIFGALLIGFIVYITVKGHLPAYAALFWGSANAAPLNPASTTLQTNPSSILSPLPGLFGPQPLVQNPYLTNPNAPIGPGNVPFTGGGGGQF